MKILRFLALGGVAASLAIACGGSDSSVGSGSGDAGPGVGDAGPRGVEPAGQACTSATQCYVGLDGGVDSGAIKGTITCLDRVPNGYCTHTCNDDSDCCAVPGSGECRTGVKQVCAPFTNDSATKYCFLSCESADISAAIAANADAGYYDGGAVDSGTLEDQYCKSYASVYATCRSSGGGAKNRKVCVPQQ
jgi:hypothetical protein